MTSQEDAWNTLISPSEQARQAIVRNKKPEPPKFDTDTYVWTTEEEAIEVTQENFHDLVQLLDAKVIVHFERNNSLPKPNMPKLYEEIGAQDVYFVGQQGAYEHVRVGDLITPTDQGYRVLNSYHGEWKKKDV